MAARKTDAQFMSECKQIEETRGIILVEGQTYQGTHHRYTWKCAIDGHIWQAPFVRILQDKGCPVCGAKRAGNKNIVALDTFLDRLTERNTTNAPITYVRGYNGTSKKCTFACDTCSYQWEVAPTTVLQGVGCPKCSIGTVANNRTYTLDDVLLLLAERNNKLPHKRVHLVESSFDGYRNKAIFTCDHGHRWITKFVNVINSESGCPHCAGSIQRNTIQAVAEIKDRHPNIKIVGSFGDSLGRREGIEVECEHGHRWTSDYERLVINGNYCPHCANRAKYTQAQYEAIVVGTGSQVRVLGQYDGMNNKIEVQCTDCDHIWHTTAQQIASGGGCPMCARNNTYSKKAIEWLNEIEQRQGIKIEHALHVGEFRIPGTRYRVDGYHKDSNTVYEFHGNYWHGNPKMHDADGYNVNTECTFGELYEKTLKKEAEIRSLGYNLVVMWEDEFDRQNNVALRSLTTV